jgi:hypothetical protein
MKRSLIFAAFLLASPLFATTYTVKASGGNFTTISSCSGTAVAGDSCVVYASASPQTGWTQAASGSAGNLITFIVNAGDSVTVSSTIDLSSQSYIRISGFTISASGNGVLGNGTTSHNQIDHNSFTIGSAAFRINDGQGSNGSDNVFSNNTVTASSAGNIVGLYLYGDRNRIESNTVTATDGDCFDLGGANVVVRNNTCKSVDGTSSGQHIDFIQITGGGFVPTFSFSLVEGNVEQGCTNDGGNCHFIIVRTGGSGTCPGSWSAGNVADTVIVRFNYAQNLDGSGGSFGGVGDCVPNSAFYNNTFATFSDTGSGNCASYQNAPTSAAFNNICYNIGTSGSFQIGGCGSGQTGVCNGDELFNTGFSGSWDAVYQSEATYSTLANQDPKFANFPTDGTLQSASPARSNGVALTTASGSGSSSTSLTVANAHVFQPGWAGTQADTIRVGALVSSPVVQISSINYSTNVITLASTISWANNDPVYLYKDSTGKVQLNNASPDVGAFQFVAAAPTPAGCTLSSGAKITGAVTCQ